MRLISRLYIKLTLWSLGVVLFALALQSIISVVSLVRSYNEYSLELMKKQWGMINKVIEAEGCVQPECLGRALARFPVFDSLLPVFLTALDGEVLMTLPPNTPIKVGGRIEQAEREGNFFFVTNAEGEELAFVRGDLLLRGDRVGYIYSYQYRVAEASEHFGYLQLYGRPVLRSIGVSLLVAAAVALTVFGFVTRRLRKLTEAVVSYDPQHGLGALRMTGKDEITVLADSFRAMAARTESLLGALHEEEERRKQLVAGISHDLRSPVTSISTGLELLEGEADNPEMLDSLREDVDFLSKLIDDLFEIARLHDQEGTSVKQPILIRELVERAARALYPMASARKVQIATQMQGAPEQIPGDGRLLLRLLDNLVRNAIAFSPEDSTVTVRGETSVGKMRIFVEDQGPGLSVDPSKIFDRYHSMRKGGVGLGLALAREISLAHGGDLSAENRPEGGARFVLVLPAATQDDSARETDAD